MLNKVIKKNTKEIIIPAVKPVDDYEEKFEIKYNEKGDCYYIQCNIEEEDLIKELAYFKALNEPINESSLLFDLIDFLNERGYTASLYIPIEPTFVDFLVC